MKFCFGSVEFREQLIVPRIDQLLNFLAVRALGRQPGLPFRFSDERGIVHIRQPELLWPEALCSQLGAPPCGSLGTTDSDAVR